MSETEYLKGRIDALSLIVGAIFAETPKKDARLKPKLVLHASQYFLDSPLEARSVDFRSGFREEFDRMIATLDDPEVDGRPT